MEINRLYRSIVCGYHTLLHVSSCICRRFCCPLVFGISTLRNDMHASGRIWLVLQHFELPWGIYPSWLGPRLVRIKHSGWQDLDDSLELM